MSQYFPRRQGVRILFILFFTNTFILLTILYVLHIIGSAYIIIAILIAGSSQKNSLPRERKLYSPIFVRGLSIMNFHKENIIFFNKDRESDINYGLRYTRWLLSFLGIWPYVTTNSTRLQKIVSKFLIILASVSMLAYEIPMLCYLAIRDVKRKELIILLGPITFQGANLIRSLILLVRCYSIKRCFQHMEKDWRNITRINDRNIMLRNIKIGQDLSIVFIVLMYSGGMFYNALMPILSGNKINEMNVTVRPLTFPGSDIFVDSQSSPTYEIVYLGNVLSTFFHFTVVTAVCNLAVTLVSHACGQIQIIISQIENLVDRNVRDNPIVIVDRIAMIVRSHVRILNFTSKIDEVLREICFMEVIASTSIICLLEYYCIMEWSNSDAVAITSYALLLSSLSFNIFVYCQIGEILKSQCERVGKAAYMIEWYSLPGKTKLSLIMVITMANYPRKLTAGGMMELSISSFGYIMRTSVAYLNMLRTVVH